MIIDQTSIGLHFDILKSFSKDNDSLTDSFMMDKF